MEGLSNHIGHIPMNKPFMEIFSKKYEVHTLCFENWYEGISTEIKQHYYKDIKPCKIRKLTRTFSSIHILKEIRKLDKNIGFDIIIMSTFSYWVTPLWPFFFSDRKKLWIIHHDDLDLSRRYPYRLLFELFVKRYIHLTLDPMIRKEMQEWYPKISGRIFELINPYRRKVSHETTLWEDYKDKFLCVSIGQGANDVFFDKIIAIERNKKILESNKVYLYFKSRKKIYQGKNIVVNPQYLTDEEYTGLINRASVVFICYEKSYNLRLSGQLLDGLSNYRYVIGNDIPIVRAFHERYPNICKIISSPEEFLEQLIILKQSQCDKNQFTCFFKNHSDQKILSQMREIEKYVFPEENYAEIE